MFNIRAAFIFAISLALPLLAINLIYPAQAQAQIFNESIKQRYAAPTRSEMSDLEPVQITSDNFTLIGKIEPERAKALIAELEGFRRAMRNIYGAMAHERDEHIRIFYITNKDIYAELSPTLSTSAFYYNSLTGPEIVLNGSVKNYDDEWTRHDLFHEYMHHFNHHYLGYNVPTWLNEGLAEYYAQTKALGDGYVSGHVLSWHLAILRESRWTPLKTLFDTLHGYPYPNGQLERYGVNIEHRQSMFYAQSWLIVHYLKQLDGGPEKLRRFIAALDPSGDNAASFEEIFELDYEAFTQALKDYSADEVLAETYLPKTELHSAAAISDPFEIALTPRGYQAELYLLMAKAAESYQSGRPQAAIDAQFERDHEAGDTIPQLAHMARASQSYFDTDYEAAKTHLDAANIGASDARSELLKAVIGFYIWQDGLDPREPFEASDLREDLRRAIALNPDHLDLQLMYLTTFDPMRESVDSELRGMVDRLIARDYMIKNPANALAMITPLQTMGRYKDIYNLIDVGEIWIADAGMRTRTRSMRFRLQLDETRER